MILKSRFKTVLARLRLSLRRIEAGEGCWVSSGFHVYGGGTVKLGDRVQVRSRVDFICSKGAELIIAGGCDIGRDSRLSANNVGGGIRIGENVLFGPGVYLADTDHDYRDVSSPVIDGGILFYPVGSYLTIGDGSWLGKNACVVGPVSIGKHCVVGANAVVTKDVPDYTVVAGAPARSIRRWDPDEGVWARVTD